MLPSSSPAATAAPSPSPAGGASAAAAAPSCASHCRSLITQWNGQIIRAASARAVDGKIAVSDLVVLLMALEQGGDDSQPITMLTENAARGCEAVLTAKVFDARRNNGLGRLLVRPIEDLFNEADSGVSRAHITAYLQVFQAMLGDHLLKYQQTASEQMNAHRRLDGTVDWERFYEATQVRLLFETLMLLTARAFRQYEVRRDWFIAIMNQAAQTGAAPVFTRRAFVRLMCAMLSPVNPDNPANQDDSVRIAFMRCHSTSMDAAFRPLLTHLDQELTAGAV